MVLGRIVVLAACAGAMGLLSVPATAQTPDRGFVPLTTDAGKLLDIKADSIERVDLGRIVYRGNASVTWTGGVSLTAEDIHVTYNSSGEASRDVSAPSTNGDEIAYLEAKGSVLVTLPYKMQGKGDRATLDVKNQRLVLSGEVTLSQRENVLRGTEMFFDLRTGLVRVGTPVPQSRRIHPFQPRITGPIHTDATGAALADPTAPPTAPTK